MQLRVKAGNNVGDDAGNAPANNAGHDGENKAGNNAGNIAGNSAGIDVLGIMVGVNVEIMYEMML